MDGFEFNKVAGAVLSAMLVIFGGRTLLDIVFQEHPPQKPGWALPITEAANAAAPKEAAAAFDVKQVVELIPKANAEAGQDLFKRCMQCHTPQKGGPNLVGPNLWGVVGREVAKHAGFPYSEAMKAHGGSWTWDQLANYIHDPKAAIPGNKMAFPGIKDNAQLADLLAYLRKLNDSPPALPQ
ncbi:MAG: cytochrome c family protein [Hyphomicrobiaceae bacterium]